jgi:hypothetical protein
MQGAAHNFFKLVGSLKLIWAICNGKVDSAIWQLCFVNALTTWQYRFGNREQFDKVQNGEVNLAQ